MKFNSIRIPTSSAPMTCRSHCGACCTAISISSPIPGMPTGKPAGTSCIHLAPNARCMLFTHPDRPQVCHDFQASLDICGSNRDEALALIQAWETSTCS